MTERCDGKAAGEPNPLLTQAKAAKDALPHRKFPDAQSPP
jgi:hypothetical protein